MKGQLRKYGTNNYYATKQEDLTDLGLFQFEASLRYGIQKNWKLYLPMTFEYISNKRIIFLLQNSWFIQS